MKTLTLFAALCLSSIVLAADLTDPAKLLRHGNAAGAIAIWQPLAAKGDINAAFNLGTVYQFGDGVQKNPAEALKWYRFAAEQGDREAQSRLGAMYLNGEGTARDEKEGWRWINAHRAEHLHHDHHPKMQAWRKQAALLIMESEQHEAVALARRDGERTLADLRRRAGPSGTGTEPLQPGVGTIYASNQH